MPRRARARRAARGAGAPRRARFGRDQQRVLRRHVVVEVDEIEAVADEVEHSPGVLDMDVGQPAHDRPRDLGPGREVDEELLHPAQLPGRLEDRADPVAQVVPPIRVQLPDELGERAEVPPAGLGPGVPLQVARRFGRLEREARELVVGTELVTHGAPVDAPDVLRRSVREPLAPHPARRRAVERAPPVDDGSVVERRLRRVAEHVVGEDAQVDLQPAQQSFARRVEVGGRDAGRLDVQVGDELVPDPGRGQEVGRHAVRLVVAEGRKHALAWRHGREGHDRIIAQPGIDLGRRRKLPGRPSVSTERNATLMRVNEDIARSPADVLRP